MIEKLRKAVNAMKKENHELKVQINILIDTLTDLVQTIKERNPNINKKELPEGVYL